MPAVFDRYSNSFLKIYFPIPEGREDEIARKVLITHLQSGNSYGIQLKEKHTKFPQPELGPWVEGSTHGRQPTGSRPCSRAGSAPRALRHGPAACRDERRLATDRYEAADGHAARPRMRGRPRGPGRRPTARGVR